MQVITLYVFNREDGGVTVSPVKPETNDYTESARIVAEEGKLLTKDNINFYPCLDTDDLDSWYEVEDLNKRNELKG